MYPVLSSNLYGIVSKKIETAEIFLVSVCTMKKDEIHISYLKNQVINPTDIYLEEIISTW